MIVTSLHSWRYDVLGPRDRVRDGVVERRFRRATVTAPVTEHAV